MRITALITAAIAVWAMSDSAYGADSTTSARELPGCPPATNIVTTFDPDPVFTWDSGCGVEFLLIEPLDSGADQWVIETEGMDGIASPVQYGVVPEGVTESWPPAPLVAGASYNVILWSSFGGSLGTFVAPVKVPTVPATWTMIKAAYR